MSRGIAILAERRYLVKPYTSRWEDGILGLEGGEPRVVTLTPGSGLGALAALIERNGTKDLFPDTTFPEAYNSPILKAAYIFSFLS